MSEHPLTIYLGQIIATLPRNGQQKTSQCQSCSQSCPTLIKTLKWWLQVTSKLPRLAFLRSFITKSPFTPTTAWDCLPPPKQLPLHQNMSPQGCYSVPVIVTNSAAQILLPLPIPKAISRPTCCLQEAWPQGTAWPKGPRPSSFLPFRQVTLTTYLPLKV